MNRWIIKSSIMKSLKWIVLIFLLSTLTANGQEKRSGFQEAMERMQAERVSFLTDKLDLTVDEAQKFWPIYNEYQKQREELIRGRREKMQKDGSFNEATDQDLDMMLNDLLDQEIKLSQLKKDFFLKIREVLPVRKVLTLHRVEQEFLNHMLNRIREGHPPGENPKGTGRQQLRTPQGSGY